MEPVEGISGTHSLKTADLHYTHAISAVQMWSAISLFLDVSIGCEPVTKYSIMQRLDKRLHVQVECLERTA
jgi:hypothetical protein